MFEAENVRKELREYHRAPLEFFPGKPWEKTLEKFLFFLL